MTKIEDTELAEINTLRAELVDSTYAIGQLAIQMHLLSAQHQFLLDKVTSVSTQQDELTKRLSEKYGVGSIDYDTGEFTSET